MRHYRTRQPHILVIGDLMLDHYLWGKSDRVSPEAPVVVVDVAKETTNLGGAGNVMTNLLALGAKVYAASVVGDDENGSLMRMMLDEKGICTQGLITQEGRKTSRKNRIMAMHQQVIRYDWESKEDIANVSQEALIAYVQARLLSVDGVLISDYKKGVLTDHVTQSVIEAARQNGKFVLVDPKGNDYTKYRKATLVTPNKKEAMMATGIDIVDDVSLQKAGVWLKDHLQLDVAMITLSEDGMAIFDPDMTKIPTKAKEVYDVTGAGDTVLAGLGFALACGDTIYDAACFANSAAAVVVGKLGSATATLEEIEQYEEQLYHEGSEYKVKTLDHLASIVQQAKNDGKKVVFTNGCFDILHAGHVRYLQKARSLGDMLILGLNSDASVSRLKGPSRPVVKQEDRATVLSGLESVDYIVMFEDDTPLDVIEQLVPHILVKGGDYIPDNIVGYDVVTRHGGQVIVVDFVEGRSTTKIIEAIRG